MVDARLPGRQPRQRDHSAALAHRADADDPQVRARPVHDQRPDLVRDAVGARGAVPRRLRAGQAEHPDLGRHRHRQDDDAQRRLGLHPRRRADRHDRGRRRAPAPAGARDHARGAAGEHRGQRRDQDPRARPERAAHAPRPDHRRRGPRRRDARHAPGDEHGPRGLADDDPRELAARRALAARDARDDRRRRAAPSRDPRADRERVRPARADPAPRRRHAADQPHLRGGRHGVRRRHAPGHLRRAAARRGGRGRVAQAALAVARDRAQAALPRQARREQRRLAARLLRRRRNRRARGLLGRQATGGPL